MTSSSEDPSSRMRLARAAAEAGRYEEALRHYLWLFEHALEYDSGFYGVRLSFVLSEWRDLAANHPRALKEMRSIRDRIVEQLATPAASYDLFCDVVALNEHLGDEELTHAVFVKLLQENATLARVCVSTALPAIVQSRDRDLARAVVDEIETAAADAALRLNGARDLLERMPEMTDAIVSGCASDIADAEAALRLIGDPGRAAELRRAVLARVESAELRELLARRLWERSVLPGSGTEVPPD